MSRRLDEVIGRTDYENLFNGVYPPADVFSVQVKAGQGILKRGSLLALTDGGMELISAATTGKANAVLAEPVDTGEAKTEEAEASVGEPGDGETQQTENATEPEVVEAVAYRTGHFNRNALVVADDYEITAADKEALRVAGILLSDAVEI